MVAGYATSHAEARNENDPSQVTIFKKGLDKVDG
jgi:hypothetical protein